MNKGIADRSFVPDGGAGEDAPPAQIDAPRDAELIVEALLMPVLQRLGRPPGSIFYFAIGLHGALPTDGTHLLYRKHGARGVLVEANRQVARLLKAARPQDQVIEATASALATDAAADAEAVPVVPINALLQRHADRQIDYIAIDADGAEIALLQAMDLDKYRAHFIHCSPRQGFVPGAADKIAGVLQARGYVPIANTEGGLIFADCALFLSSGNRRSIRSFDVFDTLIARNCIEPRRVFERAGLLGKNVGFAEDRLVAEQRISHRAYTLDDIYAELAKIRGWSQAERDAAQAAEIFAELEAVIPIAENLACVRDGDLAVSDMYLPECVIRMLLKKAGLAKEIGVVVSAHGKKSGEIWPVLLADHHIEQHLGDNLVSDVQSPERFGIASRHTAVSAPDFVESWLIANGLRDLAQIIRQARLASWHENPTVRQLQSIQSRFNFPILLLSSVLLSRYLAAGGIRNVLFCSRDCNLWLELFRVIKGHMGVQAEEHYFYTSRQARVQATPSYLRYAGELVKEGSLLVDICGTGWSLSHMLKSLGQRAPLYFIHRLLPIADYEKMRPTPEGINVHAIVDAPASGLDNESLEMCNYADHPQVVDVCYIRNAPHPVFAAERRPEFVLGMVREQRRIFRQMITLCEAQGLRETLNFPDDALRTMVIELYKSLSGQRQVPMFYAAMHAEEETDQMRLLKSIA
jgi:hypothetical protein